MHFEHDARTIQLTQDVRNFMTEHVYPAESEWADQLATRKNRWQAPPVIAELRKLARDRGLWNLFMPGIEYGAGLSNLQYAPLAEEMGRSLAIAPSAFNCAAPDTGNMEVLARFGSPAQRQQWLLPLLEARIRSSFAMTEPAVASSDATNIETRIERAGEEYVLNGRKWWITGAMSPDAQIFIVMGKTDPTAARHRQQSMVLVPRDTPGVTVLRGLTIFGYDDSDHGGHAELIFDDVRVPLSNLIGEEGSGFAIAQARLGPGRIHHCMRLIGIAERAIDLMIRRARSRSTFGTALSEKGIVQDWIAESRVRIEQLRLLVLKTAWLMDTQGNRGAHREIQAIKIATPSTVEWIVDKAIQVHGAAGLSQDFPLADAFAQVRTLRFADGPDEVHKTSLARREVTRMEG